MQVQNYSSVSVSQDTSSQKGFIQALIDSFPLSLSVFAYGTAYGALAHSTTHLSFLQTLTMSIFVFAGASQFTILSLLHQGTMLWIIVGSTFLINARQILYGLTLGQTLKHMRKRHLIWLAHGLTDESYSVTAIEAGKNKVRVAYFAGTGASIFGPWLLSSILGFGVGGLIGNPATFGLDFAYIGAFLGLLITQLKKRSQITAALLAALSATLVYRYFGTSGAVLVGALFAFFVGVYTK